jgi:hypothetical protein
LAVVVVRVDLIQLQGFLFCRQQIIWLPLALEALA